MVSELPPAWCISTGKTPGWSGKGPSSVKPTSVSCCSRVLISLCGPKTETWKAVHGLSRVSSLLQHDAVCVEKLLGSLVVGRVIHDIEDDCCSSPLCDPLKADVDLPSDSLVFVVDPMTSTTCFLCSPISGLKHCRRDTIKMNLESICVITIQSCSETELTAPGLGSVGESLCLQLSGADPVLLLLSTLLQLRNNTLPARQHKIHRTSVDRTENDNTHSSRIYTSEYLFLYNMVF